MTPPIESRYALPPMPFTVPQRMLARLADTLPVGPQWSYEIKWDGYRCLAEKRDSRVVLHSRRATHGTNYPAVTAAVASVKADHFILDGEIVALGPEAARRFKPSNIAAPRRTTRSCITYSARTGPQVGSFDPW